MIESAVPHCQLLNHCFTLRSRRQQPSTTINSHSKAAKTYLNSGGSLLFDWWIYSLSGSLFHTLFLFLTLFSFTLSLSFAFYPSPRRATDLRDEGCQRQLPLICNIPLVSLARLSPAAPREAAIFPALLLPGHGTQPEGGDTKECDRCQGQSWVSG